MAVESVEAEEIVELIEEERDLRQLISQIKPHDLPYILSRIRREDALRLIHLLPDETVRKALPKLPPEILGRLLSGMDRERVIRLAVDMPADELSDFLDKLPTAFKKRLLRWLPPWKIQEVKPLLAYPPDTAGGLMTNRVPVFYEGSRVGDVIREFTVRLKFDEYDTSNYVYAVDKQERLKGVISSKELLLSPRDKLLREVVYPPPATVRPETDQEEAARIVASYDLLELPVVNGQGRLLGAVTVDDVIDVIVNESTEDLLKLGATSKFTAPYVTARVTELVKKRVFWLIMLCLVEVFVAFIISSFERVLSTTIALAFFIPLISSTGGNSGVQSSTLVIRGLATGELTLRDFLRIIVKESLVSTLIGLILAPFLFFISYVVTFQFTVSLILSIAIVIIIFVVNLVGGILPLFVAKLKIDPATISAPLVTTVADAIGLSIYFVVAMLLLAWV
ncbi:magnesium transporter [Candidatus Bathyarchaeota archaeon]|nr:MAG: magnesium transporter [Candidatus Bathyarchaeota archaeon]